MSEITHELKTWPSYFDAIVTHRKRVELRKNDRGYDVAHNLFLREWSPTFKKYTGRTATVRVTYTMIAGEFVVMSIEVISSWLTPINMQ